MKVKQLIEKLSKLDPELRVVVRGYEGGVNDVSRIDKVYIEEDVNDAWFYGQHETHSKKTVGCVKGIELFGTNKLDKD